MIAEKQKDPPRVLLIEDDPMQAQMMETWLFEQQCGVLTAHDWGAARPLAAHRSWDLLITDVELPGSNGLDVVREFRGWQPAAKVLMMTAHARFEYAHRALKVGVDDFALKPIGRTEFRRRTSKLLEGEKSAGLRVLAIGAHPDDVEIGCGGILARHVRRGDEVTILTLSKGAAGGDQHARAGESKQAAELLGCRLLLSDLPDTRMTDGTETILPIQRAIAKTEADVIYTHSLQDNHQDHRAVHRATIVAGRSVKDIFCYQSPSTNNDFKPSRFVDVSLDLESKLASIDAYQTQVSTRRYLTPELIRATALYWGRFRQYSHAEPLEVVRSSA